MNGLRRAALAVLAAGVFLAMAFGSAAGPANAAGDPECMGTVAAKLQLIDPASLDVVGPVPLALAECAYRQDGPQAALIYLKDPRDLFNKTVGDFVAAGWAPFQILATGDRIATTPAKLAALAALGAVSAALISPSREYVELRYSLSTGTGIRDFPNRLVILVDPIVSSTGPADPSAFSSLRTIAEAAPTPIQTTVIVGSASVLTLVLGYPGFLLSGVISSRFEGMFTWLRTRVTLRLRRRTTVRERRSTQPRRAIIVAGGTLLAAIISGFVDPQFGANPMSVRVILTQLLSFAIFNVGAWLVIREVLRRREPSAKPFLSLQPASLVILAVAVLLSRLLDINPGIVFGLISGLAFAVTLALSRQVLVILVGCGYAVAIALLAWVAYSFVSPALNGISGRAVIELLSGITIEGVSALPIALVPLAKLDGATLFSWSKRAWAVAYAIGLALFMLVVLVVPQSFAEIQGDFGRWSLIFVVFAVIAIVVWALDLGLRRRASQRTGASASVENTSGHSSEVR